MVDTTGVTPWYNSPRACNRSKHWSNPTFLDFSGVVVVGEDDGEEEVKVVSCCADGFGGWWTILLSFASSSSSTLPVHRYSDTSTNGGGAVAAASPLVVDDDDLVVGECLLVVFSIPHERPWPWDDVAVVVVVVRGGKNTLSSVATVPSFFILDSFLLLPVVVLPWDGLWGGGAVDSCLGIGIQEEDDKCKSFVELSWDGGDDDDDDVGASPPHLCVVVVVAVVADETRSTWTSTELIKCDEMGDGCGVDNGGMLSFWKV